MGSTVLPVVSAYSPRKGGDKMEGGYESSRRGPDGKNIVRTLDDYLVNASSYITLAGSPKKYGQKYIIPKITYFDKNGNTHTLINVRAIVHDTGSAFNGIDARSGLRYDIPVGKDYSSRQLNHQPFSMTKLQFILVDDWEEKAMSKYGIIHLENNMKRKASISWWESLINYFKPIPPPYKPQPPKPFVSEPVVTEPPVEKKEEPVSVTLNNLPWMITARANVGLHEGVGNKNNAKILSWGEELAGKAAEIYTEDSIPWCGLFVHHCLKANGISVTSEPLWALSWRDYGIKLAAPAYGCVLVFKRDGGGHVGFYLSEDDDYYHVLGGNQSDSVSVAKIAKGRCVSYNWPKEFETSLVKGRIFKKFDGKVTTNEK